MHTHIVEAQFNSIKLTMTISKKDFTAVNELVTDNSHGCGLHLMDDYLVKFDRETNKVTYIFIKSESFFKVQNAYNEYIKKFVGYDRRAKRSKMDFNVTRIAKHFPKTTKKDNRTLVDNHYTYHFDNVTIDNEPMVEVQCSRALDCTEIIYVPLSSLVNLKTKYVSLYKFLVRKEQEQKG